MEGRIKVSFKPESVLEKPAAIATFSIDQRKVRFAWDKNLIGGIQSSAAEALRDCVLEVHEAGNLRWTVVLRKPHHKPPLELRGNRDRDIDWEGDPPPVRPLYLTKCSLIAKPGANQTLDALPADPVVMSDGMGYEFPFDLKGSKPFRLKWAQNFGRRDQGVFRHGPQHQRYE